MTQLQPPHIFSKIESKSDLPSALKHRSQNSDFYAIESNGQSLENVQMNGSAVIVSENLLLIEHQLRISSQSGTMILYLKDMLFCSDLFLEGDVTIYTDQEIIVSGQLQVSGSSAKMMGLGLLKCQNLLIDQTSDQEKIFSDFNLKADSITFLETIEKQKAEELEKQKKEVERSRQQLEWEQASEYKLTSYPFEFRMECYAYQFEIFKNKALICLSSFPFHYMGHEFLSPNEIQITYDIGGALNPKQFKLNLETMKFTSVPDGSPLNSHDLHITLWNNPPQP